MNLFSCPKQWKTSENSAVSTTGSRESWKKYSQHKHLFYYYSY